MRTVDHRTELELRVEEDVPVLRGHAAVFYDESRKDETTYEMPGGIVERIMPGAFEESLRSDQEIVALLQHDPNQPLARRSVGSLKLETDNAGLSFEMRLADTTRAKDLVEDIKAGNITGTSFGFRIPRDGSKLENNIRTLNNVDLKEISVVTFPAYKGSTVSMRGHLSDEEQEEWEQKVQEFQKRQRRGRVIDVGPLV